MSPTATTNTIKQSRRLHFLGRDQTSLNPTSNIPDTENYESTEFSSTANLDVQFKGAYDGVMFGGPRRKARIAVASTALHL